MVFARRPPQKHSRKVNCSLRVHERACALTPFVLPRLNRERAFSLYMICKHVIFKWVNTVIELGSVLLIFKWNKL